MGVGLGVNEGEGTSVGVSVIVGAEVGVFVKIGVADGDGDDTVGAFTCELFAPWHDAMPSRAARQADKTTSNRKTDRLFSGFSISRSSRLN
jgi:hypothetical protein